MNRELLDLPHQIGTCFYRHCMCILVEMFYHAFFAATSKNVSALCGKLSEYGITLTSCYTNLYELRASRHIVFVHCHCKAFSEFHVDSTIE